MTNNWRDKVGKEAQLEALLSLPLVEALKSETEMTDAQIKDDVMLRLDTSFYDVRFDLDLSPYSSDRGTGRQVFKTSFNPTTYDRAHRAVEAFATKQPQDLTVQEAMIISILNSAYLDFLSGDEITKRDEDRIAFALSLAEKTPLKREWLSAAREIFVANSEQGVELYGDGENYINTVKVAAKKEPQSEEEVSERHHNDAFEFLKVVWDFRIKLIFNPDLEPEALREKLAEDLGLDGIKEGGSLYLPDEVCLQLIRFMKEYESSKDFCEAAFENLADEFIADDLEVKEYSGQSPNDIIDWFADEYIPANPEVGLLLAKKTSNQITYTNNLTFSDAMTDGFFGQVVKMIASVNKIDISKGYGTEHPGE